ncbi:miltefosine transporter beta subunit [Trypanosoma theileri]|uniref:Miltefosine transporter beta subunit n=1 Tax=Trypanosoma theileri TaxID=67003 RepID=A0A1X0NV71_9TRYP|nr:miltefosine transporter beta subunit [Trypanosoma theileri]ORC88448.1 miltefosine transporter beta subunit [Trypanosoma theileri]
MSETPGANPKKNQKKNCFERVFKSIYPRHSVCPVFVTLALLAVVFIPVGVVIIKVSDAVFEMSIRYDDVNNYQYRVGPSGVYPQEFEFNNSNFSTGARVRKSFSLLKSLASPIYLQYRIVGFHQNFRNYAGSRDLAQMEGDAYSVNDDCKPFRFPGEFHGNNIGGIYFPCGTVAWSLFNDSMSLYRLPLSGSADDSNDIPDGAELVCAGYAFDTVGNSLEEGNLCKKKGIALPSDVYLFRSAKNVQSNDVLWANGGDPTSSNPYKEKGYYYGEPGHSIPAVTDEDFLVWASLSYMSDFTKMYRIITTDLLPGDYFIDILENFDVFSFSGEKHVVLMTRSWYGGKNSVMGILFLVMGCISFVLCISVIILQYVQLKRC